MSQLNGSAMPTLNSNLLNTRNVIGFTTSQNMTSLSNLTLTPAQSIFVVFNSLTSTNYFFMEQGPNTNSTDGSFLYGGNLDLFGIRRTVPRYVFDSNAGRGVSPFVANTWYFCSFVNSNITATVNDVYLSIVGTQRAIGFNGGNNVLTGTATNLFYLNPSSRVPASNYYAEIIIYNSALTVPQVKQMEGYLAWKWGLIASLPNGHPYKSAPIAPFPSRSVPFNGSLSSWQPTQVPGCALWLDAADSSTLTISGTAVTQWNDKSGNGNTATAPTANVPVYSPRSLNTLATLQFRSSNDILLVANNFNIPSITFFIVVNPASSQPNGVNAGILSTDTASAFGRTLGLGSGSWQQERYNAFSNITGYTANVWTIVSLQFTTTVSSALGVNGTIFSAPASGTGTNSTGLKIGSYNNTGSYATFNANFDVGEILVFSDSVTINQRQQVEGYLAWKWGLQGSLPGNHPFKRWPPSP
jgi:hypothetical protein